MFVERLPLDNKLQAYEAGYKKKLETILREATDNRVKSIKFGPDNHR